MTKLGLNLLIFQIAEEYTGVRTKAKSKTIGIKTDCTDQLVDLQYLQQIPIVALKLNQLLSVFGLFGAADCDDVPILVPLCTFNLDVRGEDHGFLVVFILH